MRRTTATLGNRLNTALTIPLQPKIAGRTGYAELRAQRHERLRAQASFHHKTNPLLPQFHRLPRHRQTSPTLAAKQRESVKDVQRQCVKDVMELNTRF